MSFTFAKTILVSSGLSIVMASSAFAQDDAEVTILFDALGLPEMIGIMREEGLSYGEQIGEDLFPGQVDGRWSSLVSAIYDEPSMQDQVFAALTDELEGDDVTSMIDFFTSELGQEIIGLEVSARRALLDESVEEASKEMAAIAMADETPRYQLVAEFVDTNDLIETNVVGAMNANYAFFIGLMQGGVFPSEMTEDQVLDDVWSQEPEIRANTTEWVFSFLMMAYQPLSDDQLQAYIDFSNTPAGKQLNAAMFGAFDDMFEGISENLGLGATRFMLTEEL